MLQVDVLHFSHFPTWQTLGLWLCLGLSSSGSWILILARGFLWQVCSLVRMQRASSAFALKSPAEAALSLLPGAHGGGSRRREGRPCPCLSFSLPWPLCQFTKVGGIRGVGCTLSRGISQRTRSGKTFRGNPPCTALTVPPGVLNAHRAIWKRWTCRLTRVPAEVLGF